MIKKKRLIIACLFLILLVVGGTGYDYYKQANSQEIVTAIRKDKINFFYRDDCLDCKKVFNQIYLHNFFHRDVQFINLNQEKNRKYIETCNIRTVPTFIYHNEAYAGTDSKEIKELLTNKP